jgi:deoxyxylulose-5-phosphate synthase
MDVRRVASPRLDATRSPGGRSKVEYTSQSLAACELLAARKSLATPEAHAASETHGGQGIKVSVVNARFVKPIDTLMLDEIRRTATHIITVEEGALNGGFGQGIAEHLLSQGFTGVFKALGLKDVFVPHGSRAELLSEVGLDSAGIAASIRSLVQKENGDKPDRNGSLLKRFTLRRRSVVVTSNQPGSDS